MRLGEMPIREHIPPGDEPAGSILAVVDVVSVFPNIAGEKWGDPFLKDRVSCVVS